MGGARPVCFDAAAAGAFNASAEWNRKVAAAINELLPDNTTWRRLRIVSGLNVHEAICLLEGCNADYKYWSAIEAADPRLLGEFPRLEGLLEALQDVPFKTATLKIWEGQEILLGGHIIPAVQAFKFPGGDWVVLKEEDVASEIVQSLWGFAQEGKVIDFKDYPSPINPVAEEVNRLFTEYGLY